MILFPVGEFLVSTVWVCSCSAEPNSCRSWRTCRCVSTERCEGRRLELGRREQAALSGGSRAGGFGTWVPAVAQPWAAAGAAGQQWTGRNALVWVTAGGCVEPVLLEDESLPR